ncbi:MAG: polysaccharide pyruvyl transferase family protein [Collinsella sp.]
MGRFSLFLGAEIVITDSFHGTAYSVNLGKKFVAISPGRLTGELRTFLR